MLVRFGAHGHAVNLVFLPAAPSVFVATEAGSPLHRELTGPPARAPSPLLRRACAMASYAGAALGRTTREACREAEGLRGATLLFPDIEPAALAGLAELRSLRALGVRTVIAPHVANGEAFIRLEIRYFSRLRRLLHALYLSLHASFLRVCYRVAGERWETPRLPRIQYVADTELCARYALFEGLTQLPPVPVAHRDIERRGGGRYSVWHGHVVFSRDAHGRRPFMLVPRNRWTEPFLELVCESSLPTRAVENDWIREVERAARQWQGRQVPRRAGGRFVVLTHCLAPGGAERQWCYLAIGLKQLGHDVVFVATHDVSGPGSHYLPLLERAEVRFIALEEAALGNENWLNPAPLLAPYGNPFGPKLPRLARLLTQLEPAALFAQLDGPNILAAVAGQVAGVPRIVLSFRNYNPTHFPYIHQDWMRPCYRALASSACIALAGNSRAANRDYARWLGLPESAVHTVPNAIDAGAWAAPAAPPDAPVIIGVFRLSEEKRPFDFLEVCRQVRKALPQLRVRIVGEGPLGDRLKQGLEPWIELLGRRSDVAQLLQAASLLLLCSSHEGMPNAVMEAQLAGLPVVASRTGGLPDCVLEGDTALLVEPGDIAGYVNACLRILGNPEAARSMGLRGAQLMREEFTIASMTQRYLALADA